MTTRPMEDYRYVQLAELDKKIRETEELFTDPALVEMAETELKDLRRQKEEIEASLKPAEEEEESFDTRNVILEVSGAAGGEEAKLWGNELLRMYTRYCEIYSGISGCW